MSVLELKPRGNVAMFPGKILIVCITLFSPRDGSTVVSTSDDGKSKAFNLTKILSGK